MSEDLIRYDVLASEALRGVVRKVLAEVAKTGLPGEHHFFITFDTQHPGVVISKALQARFPESMAIILQHQFWDMNVTDQLFEVGLSFSGTPEHLVVPFSAITAFTDPSVDFALRFENFALEDDDEDFDESDFAPHALPSPEEAIALTQLRQHMEGEASAKGNDEGESDKDSQDKDGDDKDTAEIVSLDAFRKKP